MCVSVCLHVCIYMYMTDNKGNINNERNMRQGKSLHVCRYVRTHTHTHTENEGINNGGNMRQLRDLKVMLHLTDNGKDKPATEVM